MKNHPPEDEKAGVQVIMLRCAKACPPTLQGEDQVGLLSKGGSNTADTGTQVWVCQRVQVVLGLQVQSCGHWTREATALSALKGIYNADSSECLEGNLQCEQL